MSAIKLGITTQTPLLRFTGDGHARDASATLRLSSSDLGHDGPVHLNPGGVCRMLFPKVRYWARRRWLKATHWLSLQPTGPRTVAFRDLPLELHHLRLTAEQLRAYGRTKEKLWTAIHGLGRPTFSPEDFRFYSHYNWFTADRLLQHVPDLDIAYVHDFQLLQMGALTGLAAPSCFRWHVPFDPTIIPTYTRNFLIRTMEDFDVVIVSTRRDLEGLHHAGFHGVARQVYPDIDLDDWPEPSRAEVDQLQHDLGLAREDQVALLVARMDSMKRQDLAIQALHRLRHRFPRLHLVLVGNGSFSASKGGLGLNKARAWGEHLEQMAARLRVSRRVHFAHWIADRKLTAAYQRADVVLLPSDLEGFGLTVFEAWRYGRPVVVSQGCGVSEIVHHTENGYVFRPGDAASLAANMARALRRGPDEVGRAAKVTVRRHDVRHGAPRVRSILEETMNRFGAGP